MLYPIYNKYRSIIDLSGFWYFKIDKENTGENQGWFKGFDTGQEIAVPGSFNEQLEELGLLHFVGAVWYSKKVFIPSEYKNKKIWMHVGSADYFSKVWVNGEVVGENRLGFLPYQFDISKFVKPGEEASIAILVKNELNYETIPQGIFSEDYLNEKRIREETNPPARFDYTPFGGIHRPVKIITTPESYIKKIKIDTTLASGNKGIVEASVQVSDTSADNVRIKINGDTDSLKINADKDGKNFKIKFEINNCRYWSCEDPFLYEMTISLIRSNEVIDEYKIPFGVREVKIKNNKIYLNNEPVYLKGFGKHEDYSIIGKGLFLPLIVKDFEMMKWINANSFRTSHYPYAEEMLYYADRKGFLVIDEVPAVSLDLRYANEKTLATHKEYVERLIDRDYNHPCVIMWAAGNEPNIVGDEGYYDGSGRKYWKEVFDCARELDNKRPITVPNCARAGIDDPVFEFCDVISLNRYYGWYEHPGMLDFAANRLSKEMDDFYAKYNKPVLFTEFGADTLAGFHSTSVQMFTEEYQTKLIETYIEVIRSKPYSMGEHVWNFADFRTPQHFRRVVLNLKGVFTRERAPKSVAFRLKEIWSKK